MIQLSRDNTREYVTYKKSSWAHAQALEKVVESIIDKTPALVDGLEGRRSLELISAIYESIETGNEIVLRFAPKECKLGIKRG